MNQDQRKFLLARVEQTYKREQDALRIQIPKEPSLNNYLVAACLDGSINLQSLEGIKDHIKQKVLKLGPGDALVHTRSSRYDDVEHNAITLKAEELFILPEAYIKAKEEYERIRAEIKKKDDELFAQRETLLLKIQIGSNQSLDRLVDSVDNMIDLTLMNAKLMLGDGKEGK